MKRTEVIGHFKALSDSGHEYTIIEYQDFITAGTFDDPHAEVPGLKSLVTTDGFAVNYIDSNTFKVVQTNEIVRRLALKG